jgi:hypothetical protein
MTVTVGCWVCEPLVNGYSATGTLASAETTTTIDTWNASNCRPATLVLAARGHFVGASGRVCITLTYIKRKATDTTLNQQFALGFLSFLRKVYLTHEHLIFLKLYFLDFKKYKII